MNNKRKNFDKRKSHTLANIVRVFSCVDTVAQLTTHKKFANNWIECEKKKDSKIFVCVRCSRFNSPCTFVLWMCLETFRLTFLEHADMKSENKFCRKFPQFSTLQSIFHTSHKLHFRTSYGKSRSNCFMLEQKDMRRILWRLFVIFVGVLLCLLSSAACERCCAHKQSKMFSFN